MAYEKLTVSSQEPYEAYVSDSKDCEAPSSTSCGTFKSTDMPNWMAEMGPRFLNAKIGEVFWPGTHDSGAYCQDFDYNKVVHHEWARSAATHILNCMGPRVRKVASEWTRTQTMSVRQQLEHGVRYIDLRVARCVKDDCYYIVHSFCGPCLEDVLGEIAEFAGNHEKECILLEVDPVSEVDHVELHTMFERKLGRLLLRRESSSGCFSPISLTMSHLIEKGRIVVLYKIPTLCGFIDSVLSFWESRFIHAPFVMSLDPTVKEEHQLEKFLHFSSNYHDDARKKHQNLFHFMYALTPTLTDILTGLIVPVFTQRASDKPGNLEECAQRINPRLTQFIEKVKGHIKDAKCWDMGMILSVDFVDDSRLMQHIVSLNNSKFNNAN